MEKGSLLKTDDLCKSYAVPVLKNISFELRPGEVHALVGENGAGKSTLAKIIGGIIKQDEGSLQFLGRSYQPASIREAEEAGVRMVQQELNLLANLSVGENLFLTRLPKTMGFINYPRLHTETRQVLNRMSLELNPAQPVHTLGIGQQQILEIAAQLIGECRLGVEELVYAVRGIHRDGHWYANIGYHAVGEGTAAYNNSVPAKLVRHHLKSDFLSINCS